MKNYILGAVIALGVLASPAFTQAAGLTQAQIDSIVGMVRSFLADPTTGVVSAANQSIINNVQTTLNGGTSTTGGGSQSWCHTFNTNLKVGDENDEIVALQTALAKDGAKNWEYKGYDGVFDEMTASAVSGFQEKYASNILTPNGISHGTGYVGASTRAKLNSLYGCLNQSTNTSTIPHIDSIGPSSVAVGGTATIYGLNFSSSSLIQVLDANVLGGRDIAPSSRTSTSLSFVVPSWVSIGTHTLWISDETNSLASNSVSFIVTAAQQTTTTQTTTTMPMIDSFTVSPTSITAGQRVYLSWSTSNTNPNCGISDTLGMASWTVNNSSNSSYSYTPNTSTVYTLACTNGANTVYKSIPVSVITSAQTTALPATPTTLSVTCPNTPNIVASWNAVPGATYYAFRADNLTTGGWNDSCNASAGDFCSNETTTSKVFAVPLGQSYNIWVHACNSAGCSAPIYNSGAYCPSATANPPISTAPALSTLTVTRAGTGFGIVIGTSINCGSSCTASYDSGTSVTLTASAATGASVNSSFIGWSGACSGTGTCTVSMTQTRNVTATFNIVSATAPATIPSAICGSANGTHSTTAPTINLCSVGNPYPTPVTSVTDGWVWTCVVPDSSKNIVCASQRSTVTVYGCMDSTAANYNPLATSQTGVICTATPAQYTTWLTNLYQTYLGRTPDPSGLSYYLGRLTSSAESMSDVYTDIASSPEATQYTFLRSVFQTELGRAPDEGARAYYVGVLTSTDPLVKKTQAQVTAEIRASDEAARYRASKSSSALNAFNSATGFSYTWNRDLQIGSPYFADVSALQTALTKEGVYTGEITGGFYNQTFTAIKAFQQKYGIEATGFVGPETRAKLNSLY